MSYSVAICLIDRAYGGPEEGGWYYGCGYPSDDYLQYLRGFATLREANEYAITLKPVTDELNEGRPDINSVLSEGTYAATVFEGLPRHWPDTRPRYE